MNYFKIKEISKSIFSGAPIFSFNNFETTNNGISIINIKDIISNKISTDSITKYFSENIQNLKGCEVYPGDVIISCRGTQLKMAIIPNELDKAVITANLIAIRPNEKILPLFLLAYLKSNEGQKKLLSYAKSSTMQIVFNIMDIGEILVPIPEISLQKKISQLIQYADEQYHLCMESANLNHKIVNQIFSDLINSNIREE